MPEDTIDLKPEPQYSLADKLIIDQLGVKVSLTDKATTDLLDQGLALAKQMQALIVTKLDLASAGAHPLVNQGIQIAKQIVVNIFNEKTDEELPAEPVSDLDAGVGEEAVVTTLPVQSIAPTPPVTVSNVSTVAPPADARARDVETLTPKLFSPKFKAADGVDGPESVDIVSSEAMLQ